MRKFTTAEEIAQENKRRYETEYSVSQLSIDKRLKKSDYFCKLTSIKLDLLKKYGKGGKVFDVCCGTGDYLLEGAFTFRSGIGADYSNNALKEAVGKRRNLNIVNLSFIRFDANYIPFKEDSFDVVYSFASLYYMPKIDKVIAEISRVLKKKGGVAILDIGNLYSLNTVVCLNYPDLAIPCHIKIAAMKKILKNAGFRIIEWRAFQILPLWGNRPKLLRLFLHPIWKKYLQKIINGKMLDEWISNITIIKRFAFRHIIICRKVK